MTPIVLLVATPFTFDRTLNLWSETSLPEFSRRAAATIHKDFLEGSGFSWPAFDLLQNEPEPMWSLGL